MHRGENDPDLTPDQPVRRPSLGGPLQAWMIGLFGVVIVLLLLSLLVV